MIGSVKGIRYLLLQFHQSFPIMALETVAQVTLLTIAIIILILLLIIYKMLIMIPIILYLLQVSFQYPIIIQCTNQKINSN
ncbi:hypothetical protein GLOIN_2v1656048 [Rhizophagus irregularis DAOM 181602=DAOM 197198]|uniref:Uncharacterized protein n=1 Tax=Rhizophagus irregularis (strain DAOM 181602 / DAOM 197198 / MUCL 43194) TaxID=747089 RepID=A0A2P4PMJ7_RHIID|nr:hypothetical protein GLOIN_2v1656048 [Rhizophagus irregularis DAOM 181602=DAOM 197198]POG66579.1 hypothetical protein GLOIN_2v1656048 [Rhizophagus irregularis DAOM 181602=DAOM 197198]|eukprot:XP_025173445.1 hypothetical protein GLOIN_2v1656048 [Rhizophagus irregularis DAOM 181602=DAOM 197198]